MRQQILLVDNQVNELQKAKDALESAGFVVTSVSSVGEAESLYQEKKDKRQGYDLLIIELNNGGLDLFTNIRSKDEYISMMVRSEVNDVTVMGDLINLGIDGYVFKKDTLDEFVSQVNRVTNA